MLTNSGNTRIVVLTDSTFFCSSEFEMSDDDDSSESDTTTTDPGLNSKNINSSSNLVKTSICLCLINISNK